MAILVNFPPRPSLRVHRSGTFFCIVLNAVIVASGALAQCIDVESATASRVENACYEIYHPGCRPNRAFTPASGTACNALLQDKSLSSEDASQARLLLCLNPYYPPGYYHELQYRNCRDAIDGGNLSDKDLALAYTRRGEINFSPNKSEMFWDGNLRDLDKALELDAESIHALHRRAHPRQSLPRRGPGYFFAHPGRVRPVELCSRRTRPEVLCAEHGPRRPGQLLPGSRGYVVDALGNTDAVVDVHHAGRGGGLLGADTQLQLSAGALICRRWIRTGDWASGVGAS